MVRASVWSVQSGHLNNSFPLHKKSTFLQLNYKFTCAQLIVIWNTIWFFFPLFSDITKLPTRGPCSKYSISIEEGDFVGKISIKFEGTPFKVGVLVTCDVSV